MKYLLILFIITTSFLFAVEVPKSSNPFAQLNIDLPPKHIALLSTGILLLLVDEPIREFVQENSSETLDNVSVVFKQFGEGRYLFSSYALIGSIGYFAGSEHLFKTGVYAMGGALSAQVPINLLKMATQRRRPDHDKGSFWFSKANFSTDTSFVSGHAGMAFSLATVLSHQYAKDKPLLSACFYSVATVTALSRVYDDKHWASDAFIGSALGYLMTKWFINFYENKFDKKSISQKRFSPYLSDEGYIGLTLDF